MSTKRCSIIHNVTGFTKKDFPFIHLGCPMYVGRSKGRYYQPLIEKISVLWKGGRRSFGEHLLPIKTFSILHSYIYSCSDLSPQIGSSRNWEDFCRFLWGHNDNWKNKHWASWAKVCWPVEENGWGLHSLTNMRKPSHTSFGGIWGWSNLSGHTLWNQNTVSKEYTSPIGQSTLQLHLFEGERRSLVLYGNYCSQWL